jgi:hypothetical protein
LLIFTTRTAQIGEIVDHPKPWLRYVDADDIADDTLKLDGMKVRNDAGDKLGSVDGLVVDSESGRTYYVVVDAGGWFKSKHFLMPIGQLHLDDDRDALVVNLTKDQINRFPGFDVDEFDKLTESDVSRLNADTLAVVEPAYSGGSVDRYDAAWSRPSYQEPGWWLGEPLVGRDTASVPAGYQEPTASAHDESPHFDGRAQPGDVLGIETGGEETHVGDTAKDEDKRRESALDTDRKHRS